jgi:hypothetical protein
MIPDARACSRYPAVPHQPDTLTERRSPVLLRQLTIEATAAHAGPDVGVPPTLYLSGTFTFESDDHD